MENTKVYNSEICKFDPKQVVYLKEYIIYYQEDTLDKYAIFKFFNNYHEEIKGLEFIIQQYNDENEIISENVFKYANFTAEKKSSFSPYTKMMLEDDCHHLKAILVSADFAKHRYEDSKLQTQRDYVNTQRGLKPSRRERNKVKVKRIKNKHKIRYFVLAPFLLASLLLVILATFNMVNNFANTIREFNDTNFHYKISNEQAIIDSYIGSGKDVQIKDVIDIGVKKFKVTKISDNVFANSEVKTVKINAEEIEIGTSAFNNCKSLTKVEGNKIKKIEQNAFNGCSSLVSFKADSVSNIADYAFYDCTLLEEFNFSETIEIGDYAFKGAKELKEVTSSKVAEVGYGAFDDCINIKTISLPKATISEEAFDSEIVIDQIRIGDFDGEFGKIFGTTNDKLPESLIKISINTEQIKQQMFRNIKQGVEIELTNENVIVEFRGLSDYYKNIYKDMYFSNEYVEILNESVIGIGLSGDVSLSKDSFEGYKGKIASISPGAISDKIRTLSIEIDDVKIGKDTFKFAKELTNLVISGNVFYEDDAFKNATALTTLTLYDNIYVTEYGSVIGDSSIEDVYYYGEKLYEKMFMNATEIVNFYGQNCLSFGDSAFANCKKLSNVWLGYPMMDIPNNFFYNCESLQNVDLSLTKNIGDSAFSGCKKLSFNSGNLYLTDYIENIGAYAFSDCESIYQIYFDNAINLYFIGQGAFANNKNLEYITLLPSRITYVDKIFIGENNITSLYVYNYSKPLKNMGDFDKLEYLYVHEHPSASNYFCKDFVSGFEKLYKLDLPYIGNSEGYVVNSCPNLTFISFGTNGMYNVIGEGLESLKYVTIDNANNDFDYSTINLSAYYTKSLYINGSISQYTNLSAAQALNYLYCHNINASYLGDVFGTVNWNIPSSLKTVDLSNSVINSYFFNECSYIKNVILRSVTSIYMDGLTGLTGLSNIYFGGYLYSTDFITGFNNTDYKNTKINVISKNNVTNMNLNSSKFNIVYDDFKNYDIYQDGNYISNYYGVLVYSTEEIIDSNRLNGNVLSFSLNDTINAEAYGYYESSTLYLSEVEDYTIEAYVGEPIDINYHYNGIVETETYTADQNFELKLVTLYDGLFGGWYLDEGYVNPVDNDTIFSKNTDLFAKTIYLDERYNVDKDQINELSNGYNTIYMTVDSKVELSVYCMNYYSIQILENDTIFYEISNAYEMNVIPFEVNAYTLYTIRVSAYEPVYVHYKFTDYSINNKTVSIKLPEPNKYTFDIINGNMYNFYQPYLPNYEFVGWYDKNGNLVIDNTGFVYIYNVKEIYAKLERIN